MKKFKIFLIGFSLLTFSNFAFATNFKKTKLPILKERKVEQQNIDNLKKNKPKLPILKERKVEAENIDNLKKNKPKLPVLKERKIKRQNIDRLENEMMFPVIKKRKIEPKNIDELENLDEMVKSAVERIKLKTDFLDFLKNENFVFTKENYPNSEQKYLLQFKDGDFKLISLNKFEEIEENRLLKNFENLLQYGRKIDYSKVKIKLPKNCIFNEKDDFFISNKSIIDLNEDAKFKKINCTSNVEENEELSNYLKFLDLEKLKALKKIDFEKNILESLEKENFIFTDEDDPYKENFIFIDEDEPYSEQGYFLQLKNGKFRKIPFKKFKEREQNRLLKNFENLLKKKRKIDYSKVKIKLPKNCILNEKDDFFVANKSIIDLDEDAKFKKINRTSNVEENKEPLNSQFIDLEKLKSAIEKIDFEKNVLESLKKENFIFTDEDDPYLEQGYFLQLKDGKVKRILFEKFKESEQNRLLENFKNILQDGRKIDYSKVKIKLPKNCIFNEKDDFFISNKSIIDLDEDAKFKKINRTSNTKENEELLNYLKFVDLKKLKSAIEKIDFEKDVLESLKKENFIFTDEDEPYLEQGHFLQLKDGELKEIPFEKFKEIEKNKLLENFENLLKDKKEIDYSKVKINLPEKCLSRKKNLYIANKGVINLTEDGKFKMFDFEYDTKENKELHNYLKKLKSKKKLK